MTIWHIHLLNARNALTTIMAETRATAREAVALAEGHFDLPRFDLVVRASEVPIPDGGFWPAVAAGGDRPDPVARPRDRRRPAPRAAARIAPCRAMGWARLWPVLGRGSGQRGVGRAFRAAGHGAGPVDPRDAARPAGGSLRQAANIWSRHDFSFDEWFLGRGKIRKGTGWAIAHRLIAQHLSEEGPADPATLLATRADAFRPALRRLMAAEGVEEPEEEEAQDAAPEGTASE